MTQHNEHDSTFQAEWRGADAPVGFHDLLTLLAERGFGGMAQALQTLFNEAMTLERTAFLGARPFERTPTRRGQAHGIKPKTVQTRVGPLELRVPQTRNAEFYPSALERGQRSERALKVAIAEMYVQGATTRKVTAVMEELYGFDVTSRQINRWNRFAISFRASPGYYQPHRQHEPAVA
jgi:transposase-like protein